MEYPTSNRHPGGPGPLPSPSEPAPANSPRPDNQSLQPHEVVLPLNPPSPLRGSDPGPNRGSDLLGRSPGPPQRQHPTGGPTNPEPPPEPALSPAPTTRLIRIWLNEDKPFPPELRELAHRDGEFNGVRTVGPLYTPINPPEIRPALDRIREIYRQYPIDIYRASSDILRYYLLAQPTTTDLTVYMDVDVHLTRPLSDLLAAIDDIDNQNGGLRAPCFTMFHRRGLRRYGPIEAGNSMLMVRPHHRWPEKALDQAVANVMKLTKPEPVIPTTGPVMLSRIIKDTHFTCLRHPLVATRANMNPQTLAATRHRWRPMNPKDTAR